MRPKSPSPSSRGGLIEGKTSAEIKSKNFVESILSWIIDTADKPCGFNAVIRTPAALDEAADGENFRWVVSNTPKL